MRTLFLAGAAMLSSFAAAPLLAQSTPVASAAQANAIQLRPRFGAARCAPAQAWRSLSAPKNRRFSRRQ